MKLWLTAAEIAVLRLPGLPASKRKVNAFAARQAWSERTQFARSRAGLGGGYEYHIDLLPAQARQAYVARHVDDAVPPELQIAAEAEPAAQGLRDVAAEARDARLAIVSAAGRLRGGTKAPQRHCDLSFLAEYRARRLELAPWIYDAVPKLTLRTLQRWRAALARGGATRLAVDRGAARRGKSVLDRANDGAVRLYAMALIARQPHLSADHLLTLIRGKFGNTLTVTAAHGSRDVPLPPRRTLQAIVAGWKRDEKVALTALTNPDGFKSRHRLAGSNTARAITRLNELWQIDASPVDALCIDGRHSIYMAIDVYSRRSKLYVTRTPRAAAVGLLMRRALLAWGVPERVKTDNGSDFTAKASERLFAALGIERELSPAFTPEDKSFVERAIGTFQRDLGPLLPGFIGHSVADRKVIEQRKSFAARLGETEADAFAVELTAAELQGYCDRWADERYAHRPHAGLDGATPFAAAAAYQGKVRRLPDPHGRDLDLLLAPVAGSDGLRTVGKQGVRIDGSFYLAPTIMPGTTVMVRLDPADLGRCFLFAAEGGEFLAEAICPELAGIDPAAAVAAAKAAQKKLITERTADIRREAKRIKPRDMVETVLRDAGRQAGVLIEFPRAAEIHDTPDLAAARAAIETPRFEPEPVREDLRALQAEIEAELAGAAAAPGGNVIPMPVQETPQARFRRALAVMTAMARGDEVPAADAFWLGGYRRGSEFAAMQELYDDFGEAALS